MSKRTSLHPSVQQFKQFVKKHPLLIKEVRAGKKSWQDFYEEWTILGDDDDIWKKYKNAAEIASEKEEVEPASKEEEAPKTEDQEGSKGSQFGDLLSMLKSINLNDIQGHVQNLSGIMATVQGLLQTFQSNPNQEGQGQQQSQTQQQNQQQSPFNFRQF